MNQENAPQSGQAPVNPVLPQVTSTSQCITNHTNRNPEGYTRAIELLLYEGEMIWIIMSAFMVVNTLIVGFVLNVITDKEYNITKGSLPCMIGSFIGIILSLVWYGTFLRNSEYYNFRMAQAKDAEGDELQLLRTRGHDFAEGVKVTIGEQDFQLKGLAKWMRNKRAGHMLIWAFILSYLLLMVYCAPFTICLR